MPRLLLPLLALLPFAAWADDQVTICYNWGCGVEARVVFGMDDLDRIDALFNDADTPASERGSIQLAIGLMERIAGEQTPTNHDRGRNDNEDGVEGRMDCIDHSHNSTVYLRLLERRVLLRFHRVLEPIERAPWVIDVHWAARIEQKDTGEQYVVDSWFFDNGEPAAIFTRDEWKRGAEPHG